MKFIIKLLIYECQSDKFLLYIIIKYENYSYNNIYMNV